MKRTAMNRFFHEIYYLDQQRDGKLRFLRNLVLSAIFLIGFGTILAIQLFLLSKDYYQNPLIFPFTALLILYVAYLVMRLYYFAYARLNDAFDLPSPLIYVLLMLVMVLPWFSGFLMLLVLPSRGKIEN